MSARVRNVAVLGAGTMGAQIAAHFANAGVPVLLLDVTADAARDGLARARALKPDPFFTSDRASLIRTGSFDNDLPDIASSDWILEAIVERLDVKQALFARVEQYRAPHAIVSSNTSGIPISALAEGRSGRSGHTCSERISSIRRVTSASSRSSQRPRRIRQSSAP